MKSVYKLRNYRQIKACFIHSTETRGARIKLWEPAKSSSERSKSKIFPYNYDIDNVAEQAYKILIRSGFCVVCRTSEAKAFVLICDNWAEDFVEITDLK